MAPLAAKVSRDHAAAATSRSETQPARRHLTVTEPGTSLSRHTTVPCNASALGSVAACFDQGVPAAHNLDFPFGSPPIAYNASDGSPWGVHLTGPYPSDSSDPPAYLVSWQSGGPTVGAAPASWPGSSPLPAPRVRTALQPSHLSSNSAHTFSGTTIAYLRSYLPSSLAPYSYISPPIHHVLLTGLAPGTTYYYSLASSPTSSWSAPFSFTTLPSATSSSKYPLRIGLLADVGQTVNSSATRDHILANNPQVVILTGDLAYADNYGANDVDNPENSGNGTNQQRWDTAAVLWQPLMSKVPVLACAGNHEIESGAIAASITSAPTSFSFPSNYPFQAYAARFPAPGTTSKFGSISENMYYSTTISGIVKLITLNNYIPFDAASPQYAWAVHEFQSVDRTATPWLFVQFHGPPYHTYAVHYKEEECFLSVWEDVFYQYGVDVVLNGHVHAYERTHPVYKYQVDACAPIYITIGDGGNVEGPYRNFVDETDPATNRTYCEGLTANGQTPNQVQAAGGTTWGPAYQRQVHPPNCPTTSWQPASGSAGGPPLVPLAGSSNPVLGFCQSSQPVWSAYRDPSFGHGIIDVLSPRVLRMSWFRNVDGQAVAADGVTIERLDSCSPMTSQQQQQQQQQQQSSPPTSKSASDGGDYEGDGGKPSEAISGVVIGLWAAGVVVVLGLLAWLGRDLIRRWCVAGWGAVDHHQRGGGARVGSEDEACLLAPVSGGCVDHSRAGGGGVLVDEPSVTGLAAPPLAGVGQQAGAGGGRQGLYTQPSIQLGMQSIRLD